MVHKRVEEKTQARGWLRWHEELGRQDSLGRGRDHGRLSAILRSRQKRNAKRAPCSGQRRKTEGSDSMKKRDANQVAGIMAIDFAESSS